jgi:dihydrofolate synthase/folylpolyglutamate synthase
VFTPAMAGYADLIGWMFRLERFGIKLGLENMREFLSRIGDPHEDFDSVHITGTNGKGSVCAMVAEVLCSAGLRTGLYTSPHLVDFRERIRVGYEDISEADVVRIGNELKGVMEEMASESDEKQLTFFEFTTGLAFKYFSEQGLDMAVVEVGMGGRLDATNVIAPRVTGITRIGLEHSTYLGRTIQEIAREKAGIIKGGVPLVTCETDEEALSVIMNTSSRRGSRVLRMGRDFSTAVKTSGLEGTDFDYSGFSTIDGLHTNLLGDHQVENAGMAISIVEVLRELGIKVPDEAVRTGISTTRWRGRLEIVSRDPLIIFDGSHNPDGVSRTVDVLNDLGLTPLTYVIALLDDKDSREVVRALAPTAAMIVVTQVDNARSFKASQLAAVVEAEYRGESRTASTTEEAIGCAKNHFSGKGICVIGSLYLVGEALRWLEGQGLSAHSDST